MPNVYVYYGYMSSEKDDDDSVEYVMFIVSSAVLTLIPLHQIFSSFFLSQHTVSTSTATATQFKTKGHSEESTQEGCVFHCCSYITIWLLDS